jgi:hypothetical protein
MNEHLSSGEIKMKPRLLLIISVALLAGCKPNNTEIQTPENPNYTAIAQAASRASHRFMTKLSEEEKADNLIPRQFWGEAIEKLKPIRVEFDRVNVAIVMSENEQSEEGYYYIPMISSYLPFDKENVTFEELTSREDVAMAIIPGDLSYYKKLKK